MNKKGFTLIELLAVIVILAIIMIIAVPQILNIINSSRDNAASNSIKLLKSAIKTQIASSELTNNQFTKNLEGCYEFDFDDDENSNVEKLNVKNKDRFSGQIKSCNGVLTDTNLVFDAFTDGTSQKPKKYYIYNKGTNNGLATITSSESCYTNQTLTANASLELDLTDYDKTGPLYVAFTTKPTSGGMNNFNYGSIDAYMGSASATISQIYLIGK